MSGVFLSHSSMDKGFVTKLAGELASRGVPVWLDMWEMAPGDSLYQRIFEGIDNSRRVIVVLSPNSVGSKWVSKEVIAALAKEDQLGTKIVFPIKIGDCKVPIAIADRLYADFSDGFTGPFESLLRILSAEFGSEIVPLAKEIVPLIFHRTLYLDVVKLQQRFEQLVPRLKADAALSPEQFLVMPDIVYDRTRIAYEALLDGYPGRPSYIPEVHEELLEGYASAQRGENALRRGIAALAVGLVRNGDWAHFGLAAGWFARLLRHQIMYRYGSPRAIFPPPADDIGFEPIGDILGRDIRAAAFWEVEKVVPCDIYNPRMNGAHIRVWVDAESEAGRWFDDNPHTPDVFRTFWTPNFVYRYVVPQMLARHYWFSPSTPLIWDLGAASSEWMLGRA